MKLEKYIRQLLLENEMVIVPGFGAFISEYLPAEIDDAGGEIKPPSSKLIFNPKIRNNDGLLVGLVAEATRCTHFEALQKIEKERDNILYQLDKGEKVELEELGILSYNAEKEPVLISKEDQNLSLETFGLEAMHMEEPVPDAEETETSEETVMALEEPVHETAGQAEQAEEPQPEEIREEEPVLVESENQIPEPPITKVPVQKKKSKAGWIWMLVIIIPLLVVSVFLYMRKNKPEEPVKMVSQPEMKPVVLDTMTAKDTLVVDSAATEKVDTLQVTEEPVQGRTEEIVSGKFYLIGGSFKSEENAETYLQSLQEKGFEPFHLGQYGSYFIVGIGSYNTESEALAAKEEYLKNNPGSGVWILER